MSAALEMIMRNLRTEIKRMEKQHEEDRSTIHSLQQMLQALKGIEISRDANIRGGEDDSEG
jgi:chaperonin cofactor prefoldin